MTLERFLEEAEAPEQWITIAKVGVSMCWQAFAAADTKVFNYWYEDTKAKVDAKRQCQAYLNDVHGKDADQWPQLGISITVHGDDIPTHKDGKFKDGKDWIDFISKYQSDANLDKFRLGDEVLDRITGPMPYTVTLDTIKANPTLLSKIPLWCKLTQEIDQYAKAKGNKRKYTDGNGDEKEAARNFWVIQHIYAGEAEAKEDAIATKGGDTARTTTGNAVVSNEEQLKLWAPEISFHIGNAMKGIDGEGNPMDKLPLLKAKKYVAEDLYGIKVSDINNLNLEIPF